MRSKKHLGILIILTLLASTAMISLPLKSAPQVEAVTFRVEPAITSGVPAGQNATVDVYIDAPAESAIIGWTVTVKVDPNVLEPRIHIPYPPPFGSDIWAYGGEKGYFLTDWCKLDAPNPTWLPGTDFDDGSFNIADGTITGVVEGLVSWTEVTPGEGASGTGKLATLYFTSKSETAYSPIEIIEAYYFTSLDNPSEIPDTQIPEIINGHYNEPPRIDMIGHSAWPARHNHVVGKVGWDMELFARIRNVGPVTTYGKVVFTIETATGDPITPSPETVPIELSPDDPAEKVSVVWTMSDYGRYYVTAKVYFDTDGNLATSDWQPSLDKPKTFTFNVKP